jgi:hypothetical protein
VCWVLRAGCCVLRAACCVLHAACCVLRAACCVLRAASATFCGLLLLLQLQPPLLLLPICSFIGSVDYNVYSLSVRGELLWTFETGAPVWASPALSLDGLRVFAASADRYADRAGSEVLCAALHVCTSCSCTCSALACHLTGACVFFLLLVLQARVALHVCTSCSCACSCPALPCHLAGACVPPCSSFFRHVYCLNATSGARLWAVKTGGDVTSSPAVGPDGTVYIGSADFAVYALDGESGEQQLCWRHGSVKNAMHGNTRSWKGLLVYGEPGTRRWGGGVPVLGSRAPGPPPALTRVTTTRTGPHPLGPSQPNIRLCIVDVRDPRLHPVVACGVGRRRSGVCRQRGRPVGGSEGCDGSPDLVIRRRCGVEQVFMLVLLSGFLL